MINYQGTSLYRGIPIDFVDRSNWIAVVGARKADREELNAAYQLAYKIASTGRVVVSGLALGIDTVAHQAVVDAKGKTIAIVNTPSSQPIYPKQNRILAQDIQTCGGIIFPYSSKAVEAEKKGISHFSKRLIERDLLLAHLCPTIVTVKTGNTTITGGTKWSFNEGAKVGKKLFLYDTQGTFHSSPSYEERKIHWNMEMNINQIIKNLEELSFCS